MDVEDHPYYDPFDSAAAFFLEDSVKYLYVWVMPSERKVSDGIVYKLRDPTKYLAHIATYVGVNYIIGEPGALVVRDRMYLTPEEFAPWKDALPWVYRNLSAL